MNDHIQVTFGADTSKASQAMRTFEQQIAAGAKRISSTIMNPTQKRVNNIDTYGSEFKKLLEEKERAETDAAVKATTRSNQARRILRQRAADQATKDAITAQQRTDAAIEQVSRDNLARRLRRERMQKRVDAEAERLEEIRRNSFSGRIADSFKSTFGGIASAAILTAAARKIHDIVDTLDDLSEQTGTSTTFIQGWQQAVIKGTGSIENANKGLEKFVTKIGDASRDSKIAQKSFGQYGISVRDANGNIRGTEDLLGDVAELFKRTSSEAERASIAADLFGDKIGPKLAASLAQGRAAIQDMQKESPFKISPQTMADFKMYSDSLKGKDTGLTALVLNATAKTVGDMGMGFRIIGSQTSRNLTLSQRYHGIISAIRGEVQNIKKEGAKGIFTAEQAETLAEAWEKFTEAKRAADSEGSEVKELELENKKLEEKKKILKELQDAARDQLWSVEGEKKILDAALDVEKQRLEVKKKENEIEKRHTQELKEQTKLSAKAIKDIKDAKKDLLTAQKDRTLLTEDELRNSKDPRLAADRAKQSKKDELRARAEKLRLSGDVKGARKLLEQADGIDLGDPKKIKSIEDRIAAIRKDGGGFQKIDRAGVLARLESDLLREKGGINSLRSDAKEDPFKQQKQAMTEALTEFFTLCQKQGLPIQIVNTK